MDVRGRIHRSIRRVSYRFSLRVVGISWYLKHTCFCHRTNNLLFWIFNLILNMNNYLHRHQLLHEDVHAQRTLQGRELDVVEQQQTKRLCYQAHLCGNFRLRKELNTAAHVQSRPLLVQQAQKPSDTARQLQHLVFAGNRRHLPKIRRFHNRKRSRFSKNKVSIYKYTFILLTL